MSRNLTVLVSITAGQEDSLRDVLRAIGDDIKGKSLAAGATRPHVDFPRSRATHFARFAILRDPDRGPRAARLLFASVYDGDLDAYARELIAVTADMDAIWGRCDGYERTVDFAAFLRANAHEPRAFYRAFPDGQVDSILHGRSVRRRLREKVDASSGRAAAALLDETATGGGQRASSSIADRAWRILLVIGDAIRAVREFGLVQVFRAAQQITLSLNRYPIFRFTNWLTGNTMPARKSEYSNLPPDRCKAPEPLAPGDEIPVAFATPPTFREDVVTQNQLTLVTVVGPGQATRVKAVMAGIDSYASRLAPPGSLIGISTIHFVRWLLVDDDRRLMMVSDYDGSWENYIDEFAEMILSGLDAIWGTALGYPADGARDLPAFKRFLRAHQVPAEVFYSAYPDQTILNIKDNLALARALAAGRNQLEPLLPTL